MFNYYLGVMLVGRNKEFLIEQEQNERVCPECGADVWIHWAETPNLKCPECGYEDTVKQCSNCTGLISVDSDDIVCENCFEKAMED